MKITGYPGCGCDYEEITATATSCTPLKSRMLEIKKDILQLVVR
jgi:hypothetical protein